MDELKVLSGLVGKWRTHTIHRPSTANEAEYVSHGRARGEWTLDGQFIRVVGRSSSGAGQVNFESLMTYDKERRIYRRWYFNSDGLVTEATGTWDALTTTMDWSIIGVPPNSAVSVKIAINDDGFTTNVLGKSDAGTVLADQSWTFLPKLSK